MKNRRPTIRNRKRIIALVFAILIIDGIIGSLIFPVLPDFVKRYDRAELLYGVGMMLFAGMQLLFAPVLGQLSDQRGRAPIFRLASIGTFFAILLLLPISFPLLLVNRFSDGATNGLYAVVKSAIVDLSEPEDVQKNVGLSLSLSYIGFFVGPGLAAGVIWLAKRMELNTVRSLVVTGCLFAVVNVLLSLRLPETRVVSEEVASEPFRFFSVLLEASPRRLVHRVRVLAAGRPQLLKLLTMQAIVSFSIGYYSYFVIFVSKSEIALDGLGIALVFLYFAALGIIANTIFFTKVLSRIAPIPVIRVMLILGSVVVAAYGLFAGRSLIGVYVILTFDMLTLSLVPALLEGLIGKTANEDERGEIFGISQAMASLMMLVATAVATVLSTIDLRLPFAAFSLAALAALWVARNLTDR